MPQGLKCAFAILLCCAAAWPQESPASTADIIKELAAMKRRIGELEAQLAARAEAGNLAGSEACERPVVSGPPAAQPAAEPFAFADFSWLTGNPRTTESPLDGKVFTGEFRSDVNFTQDFNHPKDDTISGSSEIFRANEVQLTQLGIGGDFHYKNVRGRLMTQFGMYSQSTPRNDASPGRGQWQLDNAYRYISEAYGGYHIDALHGINIDAGLFMSYMGLFSYYQFDNWAYQPSYRLVQHALVFQRSSRTDFPHREAQDRTMDHQRLAILRQVQ